MLFTQCLAELFGAVMLSIAYQELYVTYTRSPNIAHPICTLYQQVRLARYNAQLPQTLSINVDMVDSNHLERLLTSTKIDEMVKRLDELFDHNKELFQMRENLFLERNQLEHSLLTMEDARMYDLSLDRLRSIEWTKKDIEARLVAISRTSCVLTRCRTRWTRIFERET